MTDKTSMTKVPVSVSKEKDNAIEDNEPANSNSTATEHETAEDVFKGPEMFEVLYIYIYPSIYDD